MGWPHGAQWIVYDDFNKFKGTLLRIVGQRSTPGQKTLNCPTPNKSLWQSAFLFSNLWSYNYGLGQKTYMTNCARNINETKEKKIANPI